MFHICRLRLTAKKLKSGPTMIKSGSVAMQNPETHVVGLLSCDGNAPAAQTGAAFTVVTKVPDLVPNPLTPSIIATPLQSTRENVPAGTKS
jgi:hypothetical protein